MMTALSSMNIRLLELLRIAMDVDSSMTDTCTEEEWGMIYRRAKEQAIVGLLYKAVSVLPKEQMPPPDIIGRLYSDAEYIRIQNEKVRALSITLHNKFRENGFQTVVLKGIGNASLYYTIQSERDEENDLGAYRSSGDIDIWLMANGCTSIEANRRAVVEYVRTFTPYIEARVHHVELSPIDGIPVEAHYVPMFFYSFRSQRRFERLCMQQARRQMTHQSGDLFIPTADFNAVYQLSHILRHLFEEGIGLKQIVDYYFVLLNLRDMTDDGRRIDVTQEIERLSMRPLAGAMMYVLQEAFRLPDEYMICPPDEDKGKLLMNEVLRGGYMGLYDDRKSGWRLNGKINMFLWKWRFNMRLWQLCPREVLCGPLFRLWHYGWRHRHGYIPKEKQ